METIYKNRSGDKLIDSEEGMIFMPHSKHYRNSIHNFFKNKGAKKALYQFYGWPIPTRIKIRHHL